MQVHESQDFNDSLASDFFFIVQASEQLQVPLSSVYPLGYCVLFTFMISWNTCSNTISSHSGTLAVVGTNCYSHIHPTCPPELQGEEAGRRTLLISETSPVPCVCRGKAEASCRKAVQTASQPTHLLCSRSGVMCCSGLFRWKRLIKKGPVIPKNIGGKAKG